MTEILLKGVSKSFGDAEVIHDVDFAIKSGEFMIFVGPSGSGKSTLLRLIAGLDEVSSGCVEIDGRDVTQHEPYDRGLAMVFQSYALYPHMTVRDNLEFALHTAKLERPEITARVTEAARMLKLDPYLDRYPKTLSGGQRQRVAIGRAIVREPRAFLFDEPLSNLDAALRSETRLEIARLHRELATTMIYVTHDQIEAMTLADRIVVLAGGRVMQIDTPKGLYERPVNRFVAEFMGSPKMNILPRHCADLDLLRFKEGLKNGGQDVVEVGLRPEHLRVVENGRGKLGGTLSEIEYLGADATLFVSLEGVSSLLRIRASGRVEHTCGAQIEVDFDSDDMHLILPDGRILR